MDNDNGGNQRRRGRQINREDDRNTTNQQQNETNQPQNVAQPYHGDSIPLSLSLGSPMYASQIPPVTSSLLLPSSSPYPPPPPMTAWLSPADWTMAQMAYSTNPYLSSSSLSHPLHQTGPRGSSSIPFPPPATFFPPPSGFVPPLTETTPVRPVMMRPAAASAVRGYRSQSAGNQITNTIPPPFLWATNVRGEIHSLEYLESKQITTITGDVQCRHCEKVYQVSYNLRERFAEVEKIFVMRKRIMRERAPPMWTNPEPRRCELCGRDKAVKPLIAERKSQINWLFLLLGQTLGYCTLEQLKNFCKHSKSHRTGAKDRVLYLTYLGLCKMLQPNRDLFNRETGFKR